MLWLILALHTAEPPSAENPFKLPDRCGKDAAAGEVVVCGRRGDSPYRIGPQPATPPVLPDSEFRISDNMQASATAEQGDVGGIPTNRAMITLKIKF